VFVGGKSAGRSEWRHGLPPDEVYFFRDDAQAGRGEPLDGFVDALRISRVARRPQEIEEVAKRLTLLRQEAHHGDTEALRRKRVMGVLTRVSGALGDQMRSGRTASCIRLSPCLRASVVSIHFSALVLRARPVRERGRDGGDRARYPSADRDRRAGLHQVGLPLVRRSGERAYSFRSGSDVSLRRELPAGVAET
jgi:hypothetical protein